MPLKKVYFCTALEPSGARVHDGSTMGYFPPEWAVFEKENGVVKLNYGLVQNTASVEAKVLFELAYAISLDAQASNVKLPGDVKIGTAVTIFGSARFDEDHRYYQLARDLGSELAKAGYTVLTGGGPGNSTTLLSIDLVKIALGQFDLGPAAAMSLIYFAITLLVSWLFYTLMTKDDAQ